MTLALAPVTQSRPRAPRTAPAAAPIPHAPLVPFTLAHWRAWTPDLILDNGESWHTEDFQDAFIEDVFSGCPECWFVVPEGNGKTTLLAGLALYHTEHRPNAWVPVAAASREQAEILYRQAEGFVLRSERLYQAVYSSIQAAKGKRKTDMPRFSCLEGYRRINHVSGGRIQVFAADDRTGDGQIPTMAVIDEPHRQRDLSLYRTWAGKLQKRSGQIVALSTAGVPDTDFELTRERIRKSATETERRGSFIRAVSPRTILHEWAVPENADVENLEVVKAANPFTGITIGSLEEKLASPTMTMEHWLRFVCNRPTRSENVAIQESEWAAASIQALKPAALGALDLSKGIPAKVPIMVGLDVAWKHDTTALTPFWAPDKEHRLFGPATVLVPPRDGTMLDGRKIETAFIKIHDQNPIAVVVMDMSRAEQIAAWLSTELGTIVIDWPQGNATAARDYERFMEALRTGWLKHSGDEGLTQHALNAIARTLPYGDAVFDRPAQSRTSDDQGRRVIDALKAASMVNSYAAAEFDKPSEPPKSRKLVSF